MKKYFVTLLNAVAVFAGLLLLWQALDLILHLPPFMLPPPLAVGRAVVDRFPSLMASLAITSEEAAGGLAASIVVGMLIALIFAQSRWIRRMLYPYTILLQTVPIVAIAPLILMWVGAGVVPVALIAFIISLAPISAITGELYAGSSQVGVGGLGYSILYASSQLQTDYLFALVLAATVLGFAFFFVVMFFEWYFLHRWHESARIPETE